MGEVVSIGARCEVVTSALQGLDTPEELILQRRLERGVWPVGQRTCRGALALAAWLIGLEDPGRILTTLDRRAVVSPEFIDRLLTGEAFPDDALAAALAAASDGLITLAKFEEQVPFKPDPEQVARLMRRKGGGAIRQRDVAPLGETPHGPLVSCTWRGNLLHASLPGLTLQLSRSTATALFQQLGAVLMGGPR